MILTNNIRAFLPGLTVADALECLREVNLVCLGNPHLGWWRLAESYPAARTEVLGVFPKLAAPMLYLKTDLPKELRG